MKLTVLVLVVTSTLVGCNRTPGQPPKPSVYGTNPVIQAQRFDKCMSLLPKDNLTTLSNSSVNAVHRGGIDADIIEQCRDQSRSEANCLTAPNNTQCIPDRFY